MSLDVFAQSRIVSDLGLTLFHSLWQITFVCLAFSIALRLLYRAAPHVRYAAGIFALFVSLIIPVLTFIQISSRSDAALRPDARESSHPNAAITGEVGGTGGAMDAAATQPNSTAANAIGGVYLSSLYGAMPDLSPIAVLIWLLGVGFSSIRLFGGYSRLREYRRGTSTDVDPHWKRACASICERLGIKRPVGIVSSTLVETPIAIGTFRPLIIVPASLFLQIHPRELETIIAHELVHIRRLDPLVNLFQCAIETIFFYHPAVWWMSSQVRREREFAADSVVVEIFADSHLTYARALANLEEIRQNANEKMPRYATAANGGNLMSRIQRILKIKTEASSASSAWTAGLAMVLASAFLLTTFSFSSSEPVNAQSRSGNRKLAIGFVSIPPVDRTINPPKDSDATARLLIQKLKEYKVPATGFLLGAAVSDGEKLYPVRANIARLWIDAGFDLGLGGFNHINFYDTPAEEYIVNVEKNERVAKQLFGDKGNYPRYFSYPFLNVGKSVADRAKVETWLKGRGYTPVKYTVDNQEWMYSYAYDMARNDNDVNTMREIRVAYIAYISRMFDHFEAYSDEMFGRDIPQTMVLTPSRLTTDTADEFFSMVLKRGYTFVSLDEAQRDPAYETAESFTGEAGISWFERWAMAGKTPLRSEPDVDGFVLKTWRERNAVKK